MSNKMLGLLAMGMCASSIGGGKSSFERDTLGAIRPTRKGRDLETAERCVCEVKLPQCHRTKTARLCRECMKHVCTKCSTQDESGTICTPCKNELEVDTDAY